MLNNIGLCLQAALVEIGPELFDSGQGVANRLGQLGSAGDLRQLGVEPGFKPVEGLLAGRDIDASYETVRRWVLKFGAADARQIRL
jgi:hypothetical protein